MLKDIFNKIRELASQDLTLFGLKALIIAWALFVILLTVLIDNKWILAGILAYEILP